MSTSASSWSSCEPAGAEPATARKAPSGLNTASPNSMPGRLNRRASTPVATTSVPSFAVETSSLPSGLKFRSRTASECPARFRTRSPVVAFHSRTAPPSWRLRHAAQHNGVQRGRDGRDEHRRRGRRVQQVRRDLRRRVQRGVRPEVG
ncbi:MAG: hypothetical protein ABIQ18_43920 [Umezawaea sp.]